MNNSYFDGTLLQLIGTDIVYWVIIICTCGFGTPWAIAYKKRWETSHTVIDGCRLYFDGTGWELLGSWIKWLLLGLITCGIYFFWIEIKIKNWITIHTHYME